MNISSRQQIQYAFARDLEQHLAGLPDNQHPRLGKPGSNALGAWFLGPKAENKQLLLELLTRTLAAHCGERETCYDDPPYVDDAMRATDDFKNSVDHLQNSLEDLSERLKESVPFWSYRYQAHMNWDVTLPGLLGYFATTLYNPNNVAAEASPVTTPLEIEVGKDLCRMLGFDPEKGWGHVTCDGTVANLEALWSARNLKFYPVSLAYALANESPLRDYPKVVNIEVPVPGGSEKLKDLDPWRLLNLEPDVILGLPQRMLDCYPEDDRLKDVLSAAVSAHTIRTNGFPDFMRRYLPETAAPVVLAPATRHYSWPKAAAVLGIGRDKIRLVDVDQRTRMDPDRLIAQLEHCLLNKVPVIMTVAVIGSTEESAVDPLDKILALRSEAYRPRGLDFVVHADAAWGGYFASILREPNVAAAVERRFTPSMLMSDYVIRQYAALGQVESISIDPHKAGYVPYPAGSLCYRNKLQRELISFDAAYIKHDEIDPEVGTYGIEGSKPGAAAAGVYLSHQVIRPDQSGYGRILGQCIFNSKRLYAAVLTLPRAEDRFTITPLQQLPELVTVDDVRRLLGAELDNEAIFENPEAMELMREIGSDQIIIDYAVNFKVDGQLNTDVTKANMLNDKIFERTSMTPLRMTKPPLILTASEFDIATYGTEFVRAFKLRMGLDVDNQTAVKFLLSTTMDPWMTDTVDGNFLPTLMQALRQVIEESITEVLKAAERLTVH